MTVDQLADEKLICPMCGGETNTCNTAGMGLHCRDCWLKNLYEPFQFPPCDICGKGNDTRTGDIHGEHLCDGCAFRKYKHVPYDFKKDEEAAAEVVAQ